ncbi:MAG TPA: cation:proton antiporter [Luteibaculaceae bacterium]|nr:cation:proton antiporter [Luteibaculaceae bacterium]
MSTTIIIAICILILVAYLFDLSAAKTRIPSILLLLVLGFAVKQVCAYFLIALPDLNRLLPALGTIGLILIVLEGALELRIERGKGHLISKAVVTSLIPMLLMGSLLAAAFHIVFGYPLHQSVINAIPFCVISSAIAIPSSKTLQKDHKEFIIYESSLSDIFGVLLFNFVALNTIFNANTFATFGLQLLVVITISFGATLLLTLLIRKITHPIKFAPIIILVILIYEISKVFHLPGLIFILVFGLFLNNIDLIKHKSLSFFNHESLTREVHKFHELVGEGTFLVKTLFFLVFGFSIELENLIDLHALQIAAGIVLCIFILRFAQLRLFKLPIKPLGFIAPRGLITVLLFLSIAPEQRITLATQSLVVQVVVLTALVMMVGLMTQPKRSA